MKSPNEAGNLDVTKRSLAVFHFHCILPPLTMRKPQILRCSAHSQSDPDFHHLPSSLWKDVPKALKEHREKNMIWDQRSEWSLKCNMIF